MNSEVDTAMGSIIGRCSIALGPALALAVALGLGLGMGMARAGDSADPKPPREFSADIVSRDSAGALLGGGARLYVSGRKARIETPDVPAGFFLIGGDSGTALFVGTTQRVFMDAKQSTRLTQIFIPVDPRDPCPQWRAAAQNAGVPGAGGDWRCARAGGGGAGAGGGGGGGTIEYRVDSPDQNSSLRWIDPRLEFPVKLKAADGGTIALENIRVEAQPANLFAIPAGFRKFDPQGLIDRIKHSDVWAGPEDSRM
jgi:hypothetical protein